MAKRPPSFLEDDDADDTVVDLGALRRAGGPSSDPGLSELQDDIDPEDEAILRAPLVAAKNRRPRDLPALGDDDEEEDTDVLSKADFLKSHVEAGEVELSDPAAQSPGPSSSSLDGVDALPLTADSDEGGPALVAEDDDDDDRDPFAATHVLRPPPRRLASLDPLAFDDGNDETLSRPVVHRTTYRPSGEGSPQQRLADAGGPPRFERPSIDLKNARSVIAVDRPLPSAPSRGAAVPPPAVSAWDDDDETAVLPEAEDEADGVEPPAPARSPPALLDFTSDDTPGLPAEPVAPFPPLEEGEAPAFPPPGATDTVTEDYPDGLEDELVAAAAPSDPSAETFRAADPEEALPPLAGAPGPDTSTDPSPGPPSFDSDHPGKSSITSDEPTPPRRTPRPLPPPGGLPDRSSRRAAAQGPPEPVLHRVRTDVAAPALVDQESDDASVAEEEPGTLIIQVPHEAVVFVDGSQVATGPCTVEGLDRFATYNLRVHCAGYLPWTGSCTLGGEAEVTLAPDLRSRQT